MPPTGGCSGLAANSVGIGVSATAKLAIKHQAYVHRRGFAAWRPAQRTATRDLDTE
jgi:hypothetical protein